VASCLLTLSYRSGHALGMAPPSRGPYADVSRLAILRSMLAPVMRARLLCAERPHDRMVRYRLAQAKSAWREDFFEGDVASKIPPKLKVRLLDRSISRPLWPTFARASFLRGSVSMRSDVFPAPPPGPLDRLQATVISWLLTNVGRLHRANAAEHVGRTASRRVRRGSTSRSRSASLLRRRSPRSSPKPRSRSRKL
jgi:hypothetical protein